MPFRTGRARFAASGVVAVLSRAGASSPSPSPSPSSSVSPSPSASTSPSASVSPSPSRSVSPSASVSPSPSPSSGNVIATWTVDSTGWQTRGLPLAEGVAPTGSTIQVGGFTTEINILDEWDDGSIRFCEVTFNATSTGDFNVTVS